MMKKKIVIIKDDINFLEYPNWVVSKRDNYKTYMIEKPNGKYLISTTEDIDRLPDKADKIILYYLLNEILSTNSNKLETTRYKILKNSIGRISKKEYEKLIDSLERWLALKIKFQGIFYDGDDYTTRGFHILDGYKLNGDGKLEIYFNDQYLEQLRNTNYFKLINFDEYKLLKRPVSARLYEILIKTFKDRDIWQISIFKLAEKLTLEKREGKKNYHPSDVIIKLRPAINEINTNTALKINLDYNKETHICTFTKVKPIDSVSSKNKPEESPLPLEDDRLNALTSLLPPEHQGKKTIHDILDRAYQKHGFDYVARNITYTNRHCKGNYRAYLNKALKEDWGLAMEEDEKRQQKLREEQERQRQKEQEEIKRQKELNRQVKEHMKNLSFEEIESLRKEAVSHLDEETKRSAQSFNTLETIIKAGIEEIIGERLTAAQCR
jgi:uncharacterized FlaG/YvyC family protein